MCVCVCFTGGQHSTSSAKLASYVRAMHTVGLGAVRSNIAVLQAVTGIPLLYGNGVGRSCVYLFAPFFSPQREAPVGLIDVSGEKAARIHVLPAGIFVFFGSLIINFAFQHTSPAVEPGPLPCDAAFIYW